MALFCWFLLGRNMHLDEIRAALDPVVTALGYVLWGLEWVTEGRGVLRIFIDHADGIKIHDCEKVSKQVSGVLDVLDKFPEAYRLEVSSPGLDRPLFTPEQFAQFVGSDINVKLRLTIEGRGKFKGQLLESTSDFIRLKVTEEQTLTISHRDIRSAKIIPDFNQGGSK
jgi:ribosome maturation factor RimP